MKLLYIDLFCGAGGTSTGINSARMDGEQCAEVIVAQPFRDINNPRQVIPQWQKDMAQWAMRREYWCSCDFKDFSPRIGFKCGEYFY